MAQRRDAAYLFGGVVFWVFPRVLMKDSRTVNATRKPGSPQAQEAELLPCHHSFLLGPWIPVQEEHVLINSVLSWEFCKPQAVLGSEPHLYLQGHVLFPELVAESGAESVCCLGSQQPTVPSDLVGLGSSLSKVISHKSISPHCMYANITEFLQFYIFHLQKLCLQGNMDMASVPRYKERETF